MTDFMAWLRGHLAQGAVAPRYIQLASAIENAIRQQVLAAEAFLPPERQQRQQSMAAAHPGRRAGQGRGGAGADGRG